MKTHKKHILVVDDDYNNYYLIHEILGGYDIEVAYECNGLDAIHYCKKNLPLDLILMDVKMKGMNGFETALHIKACRKNVPIIFQTAYALEFKKDEFMKNIGNGYLEKPFHKEQLIAEIKPFLGVSFQECKKIPIRNVDLISFLNSIFH